MPGILPMKVIKVGTNNQARIAQACDRCRSKKIRCDGIRPSCTQCQNVGFECKTSDKLSRRAFPRGYTESLEERVRALEAEVRELKDLLDEKDEKIDMLSRIRSNCSPQTWLTPPRTSSVTSESSEIVHHDKDDVFKVHQSPVLLGDEKGNAYFVGTSCGRTLIDAFKHKIQDTGRPCTDIEPVDFLVRDFRPSAIPRSPTTGARQQFKAPPRLVSDQLINIYFQEWAPLFPIVHRPSLLSLYDNFVSNPDGITDSAALAQINLVFGIAALSSKSPDNSEIESFELHWQTALASVLGQDTTGTLQCFALAQIYCLLKADHAGLLKYRGMAVSLAHRLGLHQSQKRFPLGVLTSETRKKVFWALYTLDCFAAAQLGLPRLMKDEDVHCEYPVDADDEYVTEQGFLPTLPGESTKLSSAIALFRSARILAKVLSELYPASTSHEISQKTMGALADELDVWYNNLAPHLRLQFAQERPSTNVTGSRAPILSLTFHYIRSLIHRPAVCASRTLGDRASTSIVTLAGSSKSIIQIIQLLDERGLCLSMCLNRNELVTLAGFAILYQAVDLDREGKLIKDNQKLLASVNELLEQTGAASASSFKRLSVSLLPPPAPVSVPSASPKRPVSLVRHKSIDDSMPAPERPLQTAHEQIKAIAARLSMASRSNRSDMLGSRRSTAPLGLAINSMGHHLNNSQVSISSVRSEPALSPLTRRDPIVRPDSSARRGATHSPKKIPNLDYMTFGQPAMHSPQVHQLGFHRSNTIQVPMKNDPHMHSPSDWERLLGSLDNGPTNIYDNIYGGAPVEALADVVPLQHHDVPWTVDAWGMEHLDMMHVPQTAPVPRSVLSCSDESLTSGGDDWGSVHGGQALDPTYTPIGMHGVGLEGLDGGFGL